MKLRIVNTQGIGAATKLINAETGEELSMSKVNRIEIRIDKPGMIIARVEFRDVELDISADATVTTTTVHRSSARGHDLDTLSADFIRDYISD